MSVTAATELFDEDTEYEDRICALQTMIDNGSIWRFEGAAGRAAMSAIKSGLCMLGPEPTTDYWGNDIPSRTCVKEGTHGSLSFVIENSPLHTTEPWASVLRASRS